MSVFIGGTESLQPADILKMKHLGGDNWIAQTGYSPRFAALSLKKIIESYGVKVSDFRTPFRTNTYYIKAYDEFLDIEIRVSDHTKHLWNRGYPSDSSFEEYGFVDTSVYTNRDGDREYVFKADIMTKQLFQEAKTELIKLLNSPLWRGGFRHKWK